MFDILWISKSGFYAFATFRYSGFYPYPELLIKFLAPNFHVQAAV